jgi:phage terminase large subunit-like protein
MSDVSFLPVIYEATVDDDFEDERTWKKANPNYGISIYAEYFERNIRQCKSNPVLLNRFLRLHLNIRTKTETVWIPTWVWANGNHTENHLLSIDEIKTLLYNHRLWHNFAADNEWFNNNQIDLYLTEFQGYFTWYFRKLEELQDVECYGGYDNSSVNDIASFSLYFPSEGVVMPWFWVPAESIYKRSVEERLPYDRWFKSGLINNTPLASISERDIAKTLTGDGSQKGICTYFRNLQLVCFDAWGSNFIYETLYNAGLQAKKYPQSYVGMNGPCRKLQADIENKELFHGSNPVLRWMMGNVTMTTNNNDQMRPNKQKSTDKIDGVVASLMAIGGHMYSGQQMITNISGLREANELESLPTT